MRWHLPSVTHDRDTVTCDAFLGSWSSAGGRVSDKRCVSRETQHMSGVLGTGLRVEPHRSTPARRRRASRRSNSLLVAAAQMHRRWAASRRSVQGRTDAVSWPQPPSACRVALIVGASGGWMHSSRASGYELAVRQTALHAIRHVRRRVSREAWLAATRERDPAAVNPMQWNPFGETGSTPVEPHSPARSGSCAGEDALTPALGRATSHAPQRSRSAAARQGSTTARSTRVVSSP